MYTNLDVFEFAEYLINMFKNKRYKEINVCFNGVSIVINQQTSISNIIQDYTNAIANNTSKKIYSIFTKKQLINI